MKLLANNYTDEGLYYLEKESPEAVTPGTFNLQCPKNNWAIPIVEDPSEHLEYLLRLQRRTQNIPWIFDTEQRSCKRVFLDYGSGYNTYSLRLFRIEDNDGNTAVLFDLRDIYGSLPWRRNLKYQPLIDSIDKNAMCLINASEECYEGYNPTGELDEYNRIKVEGVGAMHYERLVVIDLWNVIGLLDVLEAPPFSKKTWFGKPKDGPIMFSGPIRRVIEKHSRSLMQKVSKQDPHVLK